MFRRYLRCLAVGISNVAIIGIALSVLQFITSKTCTEKARSPDLQASVEDDKKKKNEVGQVSQSSCGSTRIASFSHLIKSLFFKRSEGNNFLEQQHILRQSYRDTVWGSSARDVSYTICGTNTFSRVWISNNSSSERSSDKGFCPASIDDEHAAPWEKNEIDSDCECCKLSCQDSCSSSSPGTSCAYASCGIAKFSQIWCWSDDSSESSSGCGIPATYEDQAFLQESEVQVHSINNTGIEESRNYCKAVEEEHERNRKWLDTKAYSVRKHNEILMEKHLHSLKILMDETVANLKAEFDAKQNNKNVGLQATEKLVELSCDISMKERKRNYIQSVVAEKEHEKFELKKFHTQTVMDLMNDAHRVLDEMENEYNFHKKTADLIIDELHDHVIQLMDEVETWTTDRQTLLAEKDEIARERNSLRADLNKFYESSSPPDVDELRQEESSDTLLFGVLDKNIEVVTEESAEIASKLVMHLPKHKRIPMLSKQKLNNHLKIRSTRFKVVPALQEQICMLREEISFAKSLRRQQLKDFGVLREEEQKSSCEHDESYPVQIGAERDEEHADTSQHDAHTEQQQLQMGESCLDQNETAHIQQLDSAVDGIADVQMDAESRGEVNVNQEVKEHSAHPSEKLEQVKPRNDVATTLKIGKADLDKENKRSHSLQLQLKNPEVGDEQEMTLANLHHDEQMKPVLPKSVRDDLEAGFSSLEYQIEVLQDQIQVLQNEDKSKRGKRITDL